MESNIKNEEINNDNFSTYICLKCSKQIDARNKILHETFCMEIINNEEYSSPKQIVDTVKSLIKDRKVDSPSKVLALKLLHLCLMDEGGSEEFMGYVEKKILNRLTVLAKYKKDSNDIEKGATLFGKGPNTKASADFMKLLLLYLQQWATRFP